MSSDNNRSNNHRSTSRILDILETLASSENGYTLTEIADAISAPKSSIFPIVHTLNNRKYITLDKNTSKYSIGIKAYALSLSYFEKRNMFAYAINEMTNIVDTCSETCQLGVLDKNDVLYIGKVDSPEPIRMISHIGTKLPANCTALGKALLCDFTKKEIMDLFPNGLVKLTSKSITNFDTFYEELQHIRKNQISMEYEESTEYLQCLAVPLRKKGRITAAISVTIPTFRVTEEKLEVIKNLLLNAQKNIQFMMEELNEDILQIN